MYPRAPSANHALQSFKYYQVFDEHEFAHWMLPREGVVYAYVVEDSAGVVTDLVSFYNLPSSIIGNEKYPVRAPCEGTVCCAEHVETGQWLARAGSVLLSLSRP